MHLLCRNNRQEGLLLLVRLELQLVYMGTKVNMTRVALGAAEVVLCCKRTQHPLSSSVGIISQFCASFPLITSASLHTFLVLNNYGRIEEILYIY